MKLTATTALLFASGLGAGCMGDSTRRGQAALDAGDTTTADTDLVDTVMPPEDTTVGAVDTDADVGPEPALLPGMSPAQTAGLAPTLLRDERFALGQFKRSARPSLAVDDAGRPHVYATLWRDGQDIAGYALRDDAGWQHVEVVRGPSAGIGLGGGLAYGLVDWSADGLRVWVWRDADGTVASDNRTDVFAQEGGAWQVVDSVADTEIYQLLRGTGGSVLAALGHYGGNNYALEPAGAGWSKTFLPAFENRPLGVITPEGTIAALSRLELVHLGGQSETIAHPTGSELGPLGPVRGVAGTLGVLRQKQSQLGNALTLSTRHSPGDWSHALVATDPEVPAAATCPQALDAPCEYLGDRYWAAAIVAVEDVLVPILVHQRHHIAFGRECLVHDPQYRGSDVGPCLDEGGPGGPWQSEPESTPAGDARLVVGGLHVPLAEPIAPGTQPVAVVDSAGRLHLAWFEETSLRYALIDLGAE